MADNDFDFFDEPIASDTPKYPKINAIKHDRNSTENSDDLFSDKNSDRNRDRRSTASDDRIVESNRRRSRSYNSDDSTPRSRSEQYSDNFSEDDQVDSVKLSPKSNASKGSRKIEARVPSVTSDDRHRNRQRSESEYSTDRSLSPPSPGRRPRRDRDDHSNKYSSQQNKYKTSTHKIDVSKSFSETETLSDVDSDVTDVSPLNSPHMGSKQNRKFSGSGKPPISPGNSYSKTNGSSSALSNLLDSDSEKMNLNILMQAVMEMEKNRQDPNYAKSERIAKSRRVLFVPERAAAQSRKNYSFSNDATSTIDRENQRLMQNIMQYTTGKAKQKQTKSNTRSLPVRVTPSAVNRLREQQRIERENLAFLKRLQKTSASKNIKRDNLLKDYECKTIAGYSVADAHTYYEPQSKVNMLGKKSFSTTHLESETASVALRGRGKWSRPSSASTYQSNIVEPATVTLQSKRTRPVSASNDHKTEISEKDKRSYSVGNSHRRPKSAHVGETKYMGNYKLTSTRPDWDSGW